VGPNKASDLSSNNTESGKGHIIAGYTLITVHHHILNAQTISVSGETHHSHIYENTIIKKHVNGIPSVFLWVRELAILRIKFPAKYIYYQKS
jgi:hypothetical protein